MQKDPALDLNIELFANCLNATPITEGVAESNRRYFIRRLKEILEMKVYCLFMKIEKGSMDFEELISIHKDRESAQKAFAKKAKASPEESFYIEEWNAN